MFADLLERCLVVAFEQSAGYWRLSRPLRNWYDNQPIARVEGVEVIPRVSFPRSGSANPGSALPSIPVTSIGPSDRRGVLRPFPDPCERNRRRRDVRQVPQSGRASERHPARTRLVSRSFRSVTSSVSQRVSHAARPARSSSTIRCMTTARNGIRNSILSLGTWWPTSHSPACLTPFRFPARWLRLRVMVE